MPTAHLRAAGPACLLAGISLATTIFLLDAARVAGQDQDKPDRPPWAQKSTSAPASTTTSTTTSTSNGTGARTSTGTSATTASGKAGNNSGVPAGPPVPIVQPTLDTSTTPPQGEGPETANQRGRIRVSVNLVSVLVSVLDDHNRPAPDLPVEAFKIFDEGVQQKIAVFDSETSQPLDLALMIDASLSAHKEFAFEQEAAAHFIRQVLRPKDRLGVFSFDENVTQRGAFSDNVAALQDAVHKI